MSGAALFETSHAPLFPVAEKAFCSIVVFEIHDLFSDRFHLRRAILAVAFSRRPRP